MREVANRDGYGMPVLGQGTWMMGDHAERRAAEVAALRLGLDLGLTLIDTAEMYAGGGAEEIVAEAIAGRRDEVFVVSKVLPTNASYEGTLRAAERSLARLRTDRIDLYLLHWPGRHPLEETYRAFLNLSKAGKILHYGVSNFDLDQMARSESLPGGDGVGVNQVMYNLRRRGIEHRLLPWSRQRQVTIMAYSPLDQAGLHPSRTLRAIADERGCSPYRIALAWTIREPGVTAIPKASGPDHVRDNAAAAGIELTADELAALEREFPRPDHDIPLETS
jgi:diketogulonate reductase-like aldo/keto reductase